VDIVTVLTVLN